MSRFHIGRGRLKRRGEMNKTEAEYSAYLAHLKETGEILWYRYEPLALVLADKCKYTPDFLVMDAEGYLECHDVKGTRRTKKTRRAVPLSEADATVRIKIAAQEYPFRFVVAWKDKGDWKTQIYGDEVLL